MYPTSGDQNTPKHSQVSSKKSYKLQYWSTTTPRNQMYCKQMQVQKD